MLRNSKEKVIHLAPLFDHGLSLLCSCTDEDAINSWDVMADRQVNNYIGSRSTWDNLKLIPEGKMPILNSLKESDKDALLYELDGIVSGKLQDKIWEMIWKRWCAYEDFCNSRRV